jgi:hypothetical protein
MGLSNACATFQRLMDEVLRDLIRSICFVYLDDVIVFSEDENDHLKNVQCVVDRLKEANLKVILLKMVHCHLIQKRKNTSKKWSDQELSRN